MMHTEALSVTAPALPVDEIKQQINLEIAADDNLIALYRDAALEYIEDTTRTAVSLTTYLTKLDKLCATIELPKPPLRQVDEITYVDPDGATQTLDPAAYQTRGSVVYLSVVPPCSDVSITSQHGYGDVAGTDRQLPSKLKMAIYLLVGHWYEHREDTTAGVMSMAIPKGVDALIFSSRNYRA